MRGGGEGRVLSAKTFCDGAAGKKTDAVRKSARQKARDAPSAEKKTLRARGAFFSVKKTRSTPGDSAPASKTALSAKHDEKVRKLPHRSP